MGLVLQSPDETSQTWYMTRVSAEFMPVGEATVEWRLHRERAISASVLCFPILWHPYGFQKC